MVSMRKNQRRYVRQVPKIYGNLQKPPPDFRAFWRFVRRLLSLAVLAALVYWLGFSGSFRVRKVEVEGTHFSSAASIKQMAPLNTSIWFLGKDVLTNQILNNEVLDSVAIFRGLPDSLRIVVREKQPALIWISGDTSNILEENGLVFAQFTRAGLPTGETDLGRLLDKVPRVYDTKPLPIQVGSQVASPTFIKFVNNLQKELAINLPELILDHLEITDTTYDLAMVTKQGMRVQLNSLGEAGPPMRNLARLLKQKKISLNSQVDLRIDRWAYVY